MRQHRDIEGVMKMTSVKLEDLGSSCVTLKKTLYFWLLSVFLVVDYLFSLCP